jgi:hypothetical protein
MSANVCPMIGFSWKGMMNLRLLFINVNDDELTIYFQDAARKRWRSLAYCRCLLGKSAL